MIYTDSPGSGHAAHEDHQDWPHRQYHLPSSPVLDRNDTAHLSDKTEPALDQQSSYSAFPHVGNQNSHVEASTDASQLCRTFDTGKTQDDRVIIADDIGPIHLGHEADESDQTKASAIRRNSENLSP